MEDGEGAESNHRQGWRGLWSYPEGCGPERSANHIATTPIIALPLEIGTKLQITEETRLDSKSTEQQAPKACEQQESPATLTPLREAATRGGLAKQ